MSVHDGERRLILHPKSAFLLLCFKSLETTRLQKRFHNCHKREGLGATQLSPDWAISLGYKTHDALILGLRTVGLDGTSEATKFSPLLRCRRCCSPHPRPTPAQSLLGNFPWRCPHDGRGAGLAATQVSTGEGVFLLCYHLSNKCRSICCPEAHPRAGKDQGNQAVLA